jgi:hypothetical protein
MRDKFRPSIVADRCRSLRSQDELSPIGEFINTARQHGLEESTSSIARPRAQERKTRGSREYLPDVGGPAKNHASVNGDGEEGH